MLNYISAELYKLRFHKGLYVGVLLLILLESLVFLPFLWVDPDMSIRRDVLYGFLVAAVNVGVFIAPIITAMVFDDQHGGGTIKNEIVFGISRGRVYLGKLTAALIAGTAVAALAVGWYLLLAFLVGQPGEYGLQALRTVLYVLALHWWIWLAVLSYVFFLLMLLKSSAAALAVNYLTTLFVTPIALTVAGGGGEDLKLWFRVLMELFYTTPIQVTFIGGPADGILPTLLGGNGLLYGAVVGLIWLAVTTGAGLLIFRRREIR